ncbi:MAG TPA: tetratricopeptide repeat protein, partial [Chryseosolibacter sp.]|nr:tetratricopeptide repeat protein [Chryseosolibacter sp.]
MNKVALVFLLTMMATGSGLAQSQREIARQKGKEFYDKGNYADAIPYYEQALELEPENQDVLYSLGLSYRYTNRNEEAVNKFLKLESINPNYWGWFYYECAIAYEGLKKPGEAIAMYNKFREKYPKDAARTIFHHQAEYKLNYVQAQQELLKAGNSVAKPPVKLPLSANSKYSDYMPAADPTGRRLYFTSKRVGGISQESADASEGEEDLYLVERDGETWAEAQLLPAPINSTNHEGAACFSADGQLMIYTGCGRDGGIGNCDLYISTLEGDHWSNPVNMGNVVNSKDWDSQPTISFDGARIIFASNRPGGYGSEDLYMIERNIFGEWGPAMNLGGMINTPFSDISPFLSHDGKTLYFASYGHPGFGGYDLFRSVYENGKWSAPDNLRQPLNTPGDDRYFTIGGSGEIGFFASDRDAGQLDLYQVEIPEDMRPTPTVIVAGIVTNEKNGEKIGAYVLVEDL